MKRSILALIIIVVICAIASTSWFITQPSPTNNTTNINNTTDNSTVPPNSTVNNTTVSRDDQDQTEKNNPPHPLISADEAKELAKKYVGPGVILGKPVMTTYKRIHAWQVPVYTMDHKFINNIYIDERTGKKVD
ncbi:hypothetical protein [Methanobacterium sp.]|uniref:hypothetical protein n=1 Tax=Methanobacterium sp. TaxID=2164 RepID=UPI0025E97825|nr:hypothetical protein [Methanobacterium sp.]MBI5458306.1 hypothetical protein [Methanobacterium sp.]